MITLTADDATLAVLRQASDLAEIRDRDGNLIGFFAPPSFEEAFEYTRVAAQIDPAELERRKHEPGERVTTKQLFERLKSLTDDEAERAELQKAIDEMTEWERCSTP
jgi:hypothetical protein